MTADVVPPLDAPRPARAVDGRRERRDRNRDAVVDALLSLFREGVLTPSSDAIAERAQLSPRSLFRYFDDLDDLLRAAIERHAARIVPLLTLEFDQHATLEQRIDALVRQRVEIFAAMSWVGVVARMRAPAQPLVAQQLTRVRAALRGHVVQLVEPERGRLGPAADRTIAAIDVIASFESFHLLRDDQQLDDDVLVDVVTNAIAQLLA